MHPTSILSTGLEEYYKLLNPDDFRHPIISYNHEKIDG